MLEGPALAACTLRVPHKAEVRRSHSGCAALQHRENRRTTRARATLLAVGYAQRHAASAGSRRHARSAPAPLGSARATCTLREPNKADVLCRSPSVRQRMGRLVVRPVRDRRQLSGCWVRAAGTAASAGGDTRGARRRPWVRRERRACCAYRITLTFYVAPPVSFNEWGDRRATCARSPATSGLLSTRSGRAASAGPRIGAAGASAAAPLGSARATCCCL